MNSVVHQCSIVALTLACFETVSKRFRRLSPLSRCGDELTKPLLKHGNGCLQIVASLQPCPGRDRIGKARGFGPAFSFCGPDKPVEPVYRVPCWLGQATGDDNQPGRCCPMRSARPLYDNQKHREAHHYHSKRGDGQGIFHIGSNDFCLIGKWRPYASSAQPGAVTSITLATHARRLRR